MIQLRLIPIDLPHMKIGRITDVASKDIGKLVIIDENKSTKLKPQLLIATEESLPLKEGWYYNSAPAVKNVVFINKEDVSSLKVIYGEIPPHLHQVVASSIIQIFPTAIFSDSDLKLIIDFYNKNNQTLPNIELEEPKSGIVTIKNTNVFTEKSKTNPDDGSENRKKAMEWWNTLSFETKFYHTIKVIDLIDIYGGRHPSNLTGREIEMIYRTVHKVKDIIIKTTSPKELKQYTEQDVINALHHAELKHNKDYTKIWELMHDYLTNKEIKP